MGWTARRVVWFKVENLASSQRYWTPTVFTAVTDLLSSLFSAAAGQLAPAALRAAVRRRRDEQKLTGPDLRLLRSEVARRYLGSKRSASYVAGKAVKPASDQIGAREQLYGRVDFLSAMKCSVCRRWPSA